MVVWVYDPAVLKQLDKGPDSVIVYAFPIEIGLWDLRITEFVAVEFIFKL